MDLDLEKLKAAALAATPGEWKLQRLTGGYHNVGIRVTGPLVSGYTAFINTRWPHEGQRMEQEANAAYIAAANPAAMLEVIAEIGRLKLALENEKIESQTLRHGLRLAGDRLLKYEALIETNKGV